MSVGVGGGGLNTTELDLKPYPKLYAGWGEEDTTKPPINGDFVGKISIPPCCMHAHDNTANAKIQRFEIILATKMQINTCTSFW